jgi:hypothetical protein
MHTVAISDPDIYDTNFSRYFTYLYISKPLGEIISNIYRKYAVLLLQENQPNAS